jgi:hypothetical protein
LDLNLRKKLEKNCILSTALCSVGTLSLQKVDQKYLERFDVMCWRRMEKISWTEHARNEEVLQRENDDMNIVQIIKIKMTDRIGHILYGN